MKVSCLILVVPGMSFREIFGNAGSCDTTLMVNWELGVSTWSLSWACNVACRMPVQTRMIKKENILYLCLAFNSNSLVSITAPFELGRKFWLLSYCLQLQITVNYFIWNEKIKINKTIKIYKERSERKNKLHSIILKFTTSLNINLQFIYSRSV